jgi:hypothetical protein
MRKLILAAIVATSSPLALASGSASASSWDIEGIFDVISSAVTGNSNSANGNVLPQIGGVHATPGILPPADVQRVYQTQPTSTGGMPVCTNRNMASQQSAAQYQMQSVSRAY